MKRGLRSAAALSAAIWFLGLPACTPTNGTTDTNVGGLTEQEKTAVAAGSAGAALLSQGAGATQGVAGVMEQPALVGGAGSVLVFGNCPIVTLGGTTDTDVFSIALAFGITGVNTCAPFNSNNYNCSGSASGTLNQNDKTFTVAFSSLNCNDKSVGGSISAGYDLTVTQITLSNATWNLNLSDATASVHTAGTGTCVYRRADQATGFPSFNGTVGTAQGNWLFALSEILISFQKYGNFIPFNGTITVSSANPEIFLIRPLTIRFNSNSPITGDAEISINGGSFFTVNLADLTGI